MEIHIFPPQYTHLPMRHPGSASQSVSDSARISYYSFPKPSSQANDYDNSTLLLLPASGKVQAQNEVLLPDDSLSRR